jgi:hypothetical protein
MPRPSGVIPPRARAEPSGSGSALSELGLLFAANALTLAAASRFGLGPLELLWVYWMQSAVMGFRAAFPGAGGRPMAHPAPGGAGHPRPAASLPDPARIARVLLFPYALFHLLYLIALLALGLIASGDGTIEVSDGESGVSRRVNVGRLEPGALFLLPVLAVALALAHRSGGMGAADPREPSRFIVATLLLYARVVPIHVAMILALVLGGAATVVTFVAVKTLVEMLTVGLLRAARLG